MTNSFSVLHGIIFSSSVFNLFEGYGRDASDYEVVKERVQDEYDEQSEIEFKD